MKATKIKMKPGCGRSDNVREISEIYLVDNQNNGFYAKESIHDFLKEHPNSIYVDIYPYPDLVPATSMYGEKYVRSEPNDTVNDNLLKLPRV